MEENRKLREQQYKEKLELKNINDQRQEQKLLSIKITEMHSLMSFQTQRITLLQQSENQKKYKQSYQLMEQVTSTIFDISDHIYNSQQDTDSNIIDPAELAHSCDLFVNGIPQIEKLSHRH